MEKDGQMDYFVDTKQGFFRRNKKMILCTLLLTITIMIVALIPGIGYDAKIEVSPYARRRIFRTSGLTEGSLSTARLFNGTLQASFNPFLYPISYIMGDDSIIRKFVGAGEFWDYDGEQVKEMAMLGTLTMEIVKNLPYFLVASYLLTLAFSRLVIPKTSPRISKLLIRLRS